MNQFGVYMYILINFFKFLIVIERDWRCKEKCPFIKMYVISIASFVHSATRKVFCSVHLIRWYIVITVSQIRCGTFNLYRHARSTPPPVRSAPKAFNSQSAGRVLWPTIPSYWCLVPDFSPAYLPPARRPKNCYNGIGIIHKAKSRSTIYII